MDSSPASRRPPHRAKARAAHAVLAAGLAMALPSVCAGAPAAAAPVGERAPVVSPDASQAAERVRATGDNRGLPFAIVDKRAARLHVFGADGRALAASPVLLGQARGDDSVPGIGERPIAGILPHERTTPAGRFATEPGRNLQGEDIVWLDYDAAVSMHRVRASRASERRLERLATPTPRDNRISYGCVNVPQAFYDRHVAPVFGRSAGVVYVLPETRPAGTLFGAPVAPAARPKPAG